MRLIDNILRLSFNFLPSILNIDRNTYVFVTFVFSSCSISLEVFLVVFSTIFS